MAEIDLTPVLRVFHVAVVTAAPSDAFLAFVAGLCDAEDVNGAPVFLRRTPFFTVEFHVPALGAPLYSAHDAVITWGDVRSPEKKPTIAIAPAGAGQFVVTSAVESAFLLPHQLVSQTTLPRFVFAALQSLSECFVFNRHAFDKRAELISHLPGTTTPPAAARLLFSDAFVGSPEFAKMMPIVLPNEKLAIPDDLAKDKPKPKFIRAQVNRQHHHPNQVNEAARHTVSPTLDRSTVTTPKTPRSPKSLFNMLTKSVA
mgnify:CR=1 FL=1